MIVTDNLQGKKRKPKSVRLNVKLPRNSIKKIDILGELWGSKKNAVEEVITNLSSEYIYNTWIKMNSKKSSRKIVSFEELLRDVMGDKFEHLRNIFIIIPQQVVMAARAHTDMSEWLGKTYVVDEEVRDRLNKIAKHFKINRNSLLHYGVMYYFNREKQRNINARDDILRATQIAKKAYEVTWRAFHTIDKLGDGWGDAFWEFNDSDDFKNKIVAWAQDEGLDPFNPLWDEPMEEKNETQKDQACDKTT